MTTPTPEQLLEQGYVRACATSEVPEIMPRKVALAGHSVLICRAPDGHYHAVDEICPHKRESMAYGVVHDGKIICPHHQYAFELETGRCNKRRCPPVATYSVRVVDDEVFVKAG